MKAHSLNRLFYALLIVGSVGLICAPVIPKVKIPLLKSAADLLLTSVVHVSAGV